MDIKDIITIDDTKDATISDIIYKEKNLTYSELINALKKLVSQNKGHYKVYSAVTTFSEIEQIRRVEIRMGESKGQRMYLSPDFEFIKEYSLKELKDFVNKHQDKTNLESLGVGILCTMLHFERTKDAGDNTYTVSKMLQKIEKSNICGNSDVMVGTSKLATTINGVAVYGTKIILVNDYFREDCKESIQWE